MKKETNEVEEKIDVVGPNFEQLSETEMIKVQGAGDTEVETTPVISASFKASVAVAKTFKGKC
ncbi:mersacidin family lantibiotic [Enterococcus sp. LJL99]